ncbi:MAG: hypothetical protein QM709_05575 [Spongiibacteraceae bacterium]
MKLSTLKAAIALLLLTSVLAGCSTTAPVYQSDFGSVNAMKNYDLEKMQVSNVSMAQPSMEKISIRGGSVRSPYGTYAGYFKHALEEQLKQAAVFDAGSGTEISCVVTNNKLDGSGSSKGTADLAGNFTVKRNGQAIYNKSIAIHHEWPSSFVGAVAIPNALQGYGVAVQKLVDAFYSDKEFIDAVKHTK